MILRNIFDIWNIIKQKTDRKKHVPKFKTSQIWWIEFGKNVSTEIAGKGEQFLRPGVVLRKFYSDGFLVIPLTSKIKSGNYYFNFTDTIGNAQCARLTQLRYMDAKRLKYKLSSMPEKEFDLLKEKVSNLIKK